MVFISKPQTLVVELLSHIFLECLPKSSLVQLKSNEAPLNVSQVCRYWRNVSLSTRRLWTRLRVLCLDDGTALEYTLPALHAFLDRSGSADFRVEFTTPSTNHTNSSPGHPHPLPPMRWETLQVLLTELSNHHQRTKSITLSLSETLAENATTFVLGQFHDLDHLSLRCHTRTGPYERPTNIRLTDVFWATLSQLSSLDLACTLDLFLNVGEIQKLHRLRHLSLNIMNVELYPYLLNACPALETLRINPKYRISPPNGLHNPLPEIRILTSLRNLEIVWNGYTWPFPDILSELNLKCPQLRRLEVIRFPTSMNPNPILTLVTKSQPPLEELSLTRFSGGNDMEVINILTHLPNLRVLRVKISHAILRALVLPSTYGPSNGAKGTCPLLEEITLEIGDMAFEESIIVWSETEDMVRSRWLSPSKQRRGNAQLTTSENKPGATFSPYKELRRVNLPDIMECYWKRHQLYKCLKDCQKQGLVIGFGEECD